MHRACRRRGHAALWSSADLEVCTPTGVWRQRHSVPRPDVGERSNVTKSPRDATDDVKESFRSPSGGASVSPRRRVIPVIARQVPEVATPRVT